MTTNKKNEEINNSEDTINEDSITPTRKKNETK